MQQSAFAGGFTVKSQVTKGAAIITVKPNSAAIEAAPADLAAETVDLTLSDLATSSTITERKPKEKSGRPELTDAQIVDLRKEARLAGDDDATVRA